MRISDWSSDVCSSDLRAGRACGQKPRQRGPVGPGSTRERCSEQSALYRAGRRLTCGTAPDIRCGRESPVRAFRQGLLWVEKIGRASSRERVCHVSISVVALSLKKNKSYNSDDISITHK